MIEIKLLLLLLIANGAPILAREAVGGRFNLPLDGGHRAADGRFWLGPTKTFRGIIAAIVFTGFAAPLLGIDWKIGVATALLAMFGDLIGSFCKRRLGIASSTQAIGLDQIPESLLPLLVLAKTLQLSCYSVLIIAAAFFILVLALSRLLYWIGVRKHPY
jgi:CDP-2,3-bis-(O-geranylgeranyl)-sn-glycerol synthase